MVYGCLLMRTLFPTMLGSAPKSLFQADQESTPTDSLEVLPAHFVSPDRSGSAVGFQAKILDVNSGNRRKHRIVIADILHFRIAKNRIGLTRPRELHQLVWIRHIQGSQDQCLQHSEKR